MNKVQRRSIKIAKRILHEDLIDKYAARGISKSVIYKRISKALGYTFHCSELDENSDLPFILESVKTVIHEIDEEYMSKS